MKNTQNRVKTRKTRKNMFLCVFVQTKDTDKVIKN